MRFKIKDEKVKTDVVTTYLVVNTAGGLVLYGEIDGFKQALLTIDNNGVVHRHSFYDDVARAMANETTARLKDEDD